MRNFLRRCSLAKWKLIRFEKSLLRHETLLLTLAFTSFEYSFIGSWFEIRQSTIYYAGLLGRWYKQIVEQESDVPSIIFFFILFIDLGHSKLFIFVIL